MSWRDARFIAAKQLRYLLMERETLVWTFLMPIVFFYFIGEVTGGFGGSGVLGGETLAVREAEDGGFLQDEVLRRVEEQEFELVRPDPEEDPAGYARWLEFPAGFTGKALAGDEAVVSFRRRGEGTSTDYERVRLTRAVYTVLADLLVLEQEGTEPSAQAFHQLAERKRSLELVVRPAGERREIPTGFDQAIPGIMVMFTMSILLSSTSVLLVVERQRGLLRRLASTPISRGSLVLGKWLGAMVMGLVQLAFALVAGWLVFGMDWGPSLPALFGILVLWAAFNAAAGLLLGNVARNEAQAAGVGTLAALVLAALGGCWWPIEITPQWMQTFALALPSGWAMDSMHRLVNFGQPAAAVVGHGVALAVGSLVVGWLAAKTFRYQ